MKSATAAFAVIISISVYTVVLGITYPFLSLNLIEIGAPAEIVGVNSAMIPIGLLISSLTYRYFLALLKPLQFAIISIIASTILLAAIFYLEHITVYRTLVISWIPLCVLLGFSVNGLFIIGEAWINKLAPDSVRGRLLGVYTTALIAGYGVGPLLISLLSHDGINLYVVSIGLLLTSILPILIMKDVIRNVNFDIVEDEGGKSGGNAGRYTGFILSNMLIVLCFASIAIFDNVSVSFMPVYFNLSGLNVGQSSLLLSVTILGGAIFQPFVGYLADRFSNKAIIATFSISTILTGLYFILFERSSTDYILCFLWGGCAFANYTMALKELGDQYSDERLVLGSAVLAMTWAVSTIIGLPLMGVIISTFGLGSFPSFVIFLYPFVILLCVLGKRRARVARII